MVGILYSRPDQVFEVASYLANRFESISLGASADIVFNLKRRQGKKIEDEKHRSKMSLVFAQIAHHISPPEAFPPGDGMTLTKALENVGPLARGLFGDKDSEKYSPEYLAKLWNDPSYAHMRTTLRTPFDPDSPLPFAPTKG